MIRRARFQLIILCVVQNLFAQNTGYLTNDGAWCWFSDPRAITVGENIITGWVKSNGTIEAAKINPTTAEIQLSELYYKLESDDHNNPSFTVDENGAIVAMYTRHSKKDLFINILNDHQGQFEFSAPRLIHPWSDQQLEKYPRKTMTYANLIRLDDEGGRVYCFGRWTGFKPNLMWSDDLLNWSDAKVFVTNYPFNSNNRPYVKYYSDGKSRIHIIFTDGHPRDEPNNSVYYAYYEKGAFFKITGELICTMDQLPFEPKEASVVYTSNQMDGRAWIADVAVNEEGNPVILYTRSPTELNHEYWYASYSGKGWVNHKICDSGPWFPETPEGSQEPEPHYFGGLSVQPENVNVVYLSRQVDGVFEIERWETKDKGMSWKTKAITENSLKDNVRPIVPRGFSEKEGEIVLWMEIEKYRHYTDFKASVKYLYELAEE
jgi:hypothetical protein